MNPLLHELLKLFKSLPAILQALVLFGLLGFLLVIGFNPGVGATIVGFIVTLYSLNLKNKP